MKYQAIKPRWWKKNQLTEELNKKKKHSCIFFYLIETVSFCNVGQSSVPSMMTSFVKLVWDSTRGACSSGWRVLERRGRASVFGWTIRGSWRFFRCFCSSSDLCRRKKKLKPNPLLKTTDGFLTVEDGRKRSSKCTKYSKNAIWAYWECGRG